MASKQAFEFLAASYNIRSGPSRLDLVDAYFINRTKVLRFDRTCCLQVRALFSTRNRNQFFIVGIAVMEDGSRINKDVPPSEVIIAYDVETRVGGLCYMPATMKLSDLLNQEGIP